MVGDYQYDVGSSVRLVRGGQARTVIWRGQLKVRNHQGMWQRAFSCRLDNGFWDCCYEGKLYRI